MPPATALGGLAAPTKSPAQRGQLASTGPKSSTAQAAGGSAASASKLTQLPWPRRTLQTGAQSPETGPQSQPPVPSKALQSQARALKPAHGQAAPPVSLPQAAPPATQRSLPLQASAPSGPGRTTGASPPVPGKALQQQAQKLTAPASSQPPMPSKVLQAQAQSLKPSAPSQPKLPSPSLQLQAQSLKPAESTSHHAAPKSAEPAELEEPVMESFLNEEIPDGRQSQAAHQSMPHVNQTTPARASQIGGLGLLGTSDEFSYLPSAGYKLE